MNPTDNTSPTSDTTETYVPVKGYEGLYEVSNLGNVRSIAGGRRKGTLLKLWSRVKGYSGVSLCKDGTSRSYFVHRLVAEQFIPNPENKPTVNHKDGNKTNNAFSNLEWATQAENTQHSFKVLGKVVHNKGKIAFVTKKCVGCMEQFTSRVWRNRRYCGQECYHKNKEVKHG